MWVHFYVYFLSFMQMKLCFLVIVNNSRHFCWVSLKSNIICAVCNYTGWPFHCTLSKCAWLTRKSFRNCRSRSGLNVFRAEQQLKFHAKDSTSALKRNEGQKTVYIKCVELRRKRCTIRVCFLHPNLRNLSELFGFCSFFQRKLTQWAIYNQEKFPGSNLLLHFGKGDNVKHKSHYWERWGRYWLMNEWQMFLFEEQRGSSALIDPLETSLHIFQSLSPTFVF